MDSQELKRILKEEVESRKKKLAKKDPGEEEPKEIKTELAEKPEVIEEYEPLPEASKDLESKLIPQKEESEIFPESSKESNEEESEKDEFLMGDISKLETISLDNNHQILKFLKILFQEWKKETVNTSDPLMRKICQNSDKDIEPLFEMFALISDQEISPAMKHVKDIAVWIKNREYVKANDVYLRLAIGNNPWPIGIYIINI
jgi:pre-mRNA-splicing factor 18